MSSRKASSSIFAPSSRAVAFVLFVLASSALSADEPNAPVAKPIVRVGDRWTYRTMDYWTNAIVRTVEVRVSFMGPDEILTTNTTKGNERETDSNYKSDWAIMAAGGSVYDPPQRWLQFPLQVGATYKVDYQLIAKKDSPIRVKSEAMIKVVGWEDVVVPAGKFRALKLEAEGTYQRIDVSCGGWARRQIWYVPDVKRWVKFTYEDSRCGSNSAFAKDGIELVDFQVK